MKKLKILAAAICVLCAFSLSFYSLNAQDPTELPPVYVICDGGDSGQCHGQDCKYVIFFPFPVRLTYCTGFTGKMSDYCVPDIPCGVW